MENLIEEIEHKGFIIRTYYDTDAEEPGAYDELVTIIGWHRRYNIGSKHSFDNPQDFIDHAEETGTILYMPVYMYEHSGIALSTSNGSYPFTCPWDSGQVGFVYTDTHRILQAFGTSNVSEEVKSLFEQEQPVPLNKLTPELLQKVIPCLRASVETHGQWMNGNVYCFDIEDPDGDHYDSCCGFYDYDYMIENCKENIPNNWIPKPKAEDQLAGILNAIAVIGGNLPDDRLIDATGPNDAAYRGTMYVEARDLARKGLELLGRKLPPINHEQ